MSGFVSTPTSDTCLTTIYDINTRLSTKQSLYIVPSGKTCLITKVFVRSANNPLTAAKGTFGFNANADDVVAELDLTSISDSTLYLVGYPITAAAKIGSSGSVFGFKTTVQEATSDTVTIDVFGYLV